MSEGNRLFHWQVYVCDVMAVTSEPINSVNCTLTLRLTDHIYSGNLLIALPRTFRTSKDARCDSGEDFLSFCNSKPNYECNNIIISKMNDKKKSLCENITELNDSSPRFFVCCIYFLHISQQHNILLLHHLFCSKKHPVPQHPKDHSRL